ncbi:MAG: DUF2779 domain-containing protein [Saprospiraceae bacterium]|nr:DUF2779 domain-containing protein [Saprospiraceae bacterium]
MNFQLTKTEFIQYLNCPESLWLLKNKPNDYPKEAPSLFLQKLIKEGYEVEEFAKKLFPNGKDLPEKADPDFTEKQLNTDAKIFFQPSFKTSKNVFARIDVLEKLEDGSFHIYEVKSSTKIKDDQKHNHLKDACFQKYVLQECGYNVSGVSMMHLNKDYIKNGEINAREIIKTKEVSEKIKDLYPMVVKDIEDALHFINRSSINESECSCRYNTRSNHCLSFNYFNKNIPDYSIYEIINIRAKRINELLNMGCNCISDIPSDYNLNSKQKLQVASAKQNTPIIDQASISKSLNELEFPLHFIDYETYTNAIPQVNQFGPQKHLVFQVSIHTMLANGDLSHFEWLGNKMELPTDMLQKMKQFTGLTGTFISWHASFERDRNKEMMAMHPEYKQYLDYINTQMYDLEVLFKEPYIDYRFRGSSSIKKVLPIICPHLNYNALEVQNGTMAMDTWGRMMLDPDFDESIEHTRKELLEYCKLDTFAMVELYRFLMEL